MTGARTGAISGFTARFGTAPEALFSAPARVNLIGEHTDYNEGFVLPAAIDRRIYLAVRRRADRVICVVAGDLDDAESIWTAGSSNPVARDSQQQWANYARGVAEQFRKRNLAITGIDAYVRSDIPHGGGLGSSAALCASFAFALDSEHELGIPARELAAWCQAAEHEYVDSRCGIMDQMASLMGIERHALLIDCRTLTVEQVSLPDDAEIVMIESGQSHRHAGGEYNVRRAQCETAASAMGLASLRDATMQTLEANRSSMDERVYRRARHVLTENDRTLAMANALRNGDYGEIGRLMAESHASMRDDFGISTPEIDALVGIVTDSLGEAGGARLTGGGFGGSVVALAPAHDAARIDRTVIDRYARETGLTANIQRCKATHGARKE